MLMNSFCFLFCVSPLIDFWYAHLTLTISDCYKDGFRFRVFHIKAWFGPPKISESFNLQWTDFTIFAFCYWRISYTSFHFGTKQRAPLGKCFFMKVTELPRQFGSISHHSVIRKGKSLLYYNGFYIALMTHTTIFPTNGLCIVYCRLPQCFSLV